MEILPINKINIAELNNYILSKNIKEYLDFYKFEENCEYFEMIKKCILNKYSISLLGIENNTIVGFIIGESLYDEKLKAKIAKVEYTVYENMLCYESLLNKFQQVAKEKECKYIKVCTPEFQKEVITILDLNNFNTYKIKLEKELI